MTVVLDAGALIAVDRKEGSMTTVIEAALRIKRRVVTTAPVVGQAWRDGARQARLARTLARIDVRSVGLEEAKQAGALLARSKTSDVVDALLTVLVEPGDEVMTSDPGDVAALLRSRHVEARVSVV